MANALDNQILGYFVQLNEAEKKSVLLMLKTFIAGRNQSENALFLEQYNQEIDEALAEVEQGDYITQDEMEKRASKW